jgi:amidase
VRETWPHEIAGHPMSIYSEWMKAVCLISMTDCPSLAAPAGQSPFLHAIGSAGAGR